MPGGIADSETPPFWSKFHCTAPGTYAVSVERGVVISPITSSGSIPENRIYTEPSNLVDGDGNPTLFTIATGESLYCVVYMDASAVVSSVILGVYTEGSPPTGTDGGSNTVYSFKLCTLETVTVNGISGLVLTRHKCGDNIDLCGRNLNHVIHVIELVGGVLYQTSYYTICWRFGDYVGKFASGATLPPVIGTVDSTDATYISAGVTT